MKGLKKKLIFGIIITVFLIVSGIVMLMAENKTELFVPIVFVFAFSGGMTLWMVLNLRESKRRKEENFRRKNR